MTIFDTDEQFAVNLKRHFNIEKTHLVVNGTWTVRAERYVIDMVKFIDTIMAKPENQGKEQGSFGEFVLRTYGQEAYDWFQLHATPPTMKDF